jgi:hypothetical protein
MLIYDRPCLYAFIAIVIAAIASAIIYLVARYRLENNKKKSVVIEKPAKKQQTEEEEKKQPDQTPKLYGRQSAMVGPYGRRSASLRPNGRSSDGVDGGRLAPTGRSSRDPPGRTASLGFE